MKKNLVFLFALVFTAGLNAQTVSTDFEASAGNRGAETCWGFGGFSLSDKTNRKPINGYSARSGSLTTDKDRFWMKSPFIELGSGNITFNARLSSTDGTRTYKIYVDFISYDATDNWGEGTIVTGTEISLTANHFNIINHSVPIPAAIANDGNAYKVYWRFESTSGNRNRRAIMDDISIPGQYVSDPTDNCKPIVTVADSDFDGINDDVDEYPNDADRAYDSYYPSSSVFGTYAYEDLWPSKGDYDFNDLVLGHQQKFIYNANNRIKEIEAKFVIRAMGGDLIEGFGIHLYGIAPGDIASVSGNSLTTGTISLAANGTEQNQNYAVVILCDDVETIINRTSGAFFNTVPSNPVGTADTLTVNIIFSNPVTSQQIGDRSIFVYKQRNQEIHMKDKVPTDLADVSLFGTLDDDTDPATGKYYCTSAGHPWAIEVSEGFDYPVERTDIVQAYLNFANWAQTAGQSSPLWYRDESGNRDAAKIF